MPATALTQPLNIFIDRGEQIQTQIEVLQGRSLIEKTIAALPDDFFSLPEPEGTPGGIRHLFKTAVSYVLSGIRWSLERVGLLPEVNEHERLVLDCSNRLTAKRQKETYLIVVSFRHPSLHLAQAFLTQFIEVYVREKSAQEDSTAPFFANQERALERELTTARIALSAYRQQWGILDVEAQRQQLVREYGRLVTAINEDKAELTKVSLALQNLRNPEVAEPESTLPLALRQDPGITETLRNLAGLHARENRMDTEMGGRHPEKSALQQEIALLRTDIRNEGIRILQNRENTINASIKDLGNLRDELKAGILTLDAKSREMRTLETSVDVLDTALSRYAEKRETSRVTAAMGAQQINAIQLVEAPNLTYKPVSPKPMRNLILGFVFSLLVGLSYAFAADYFSGTVNTLEDLRSYVNDTVAVYLPDLDRPWAGSPRPAFLTARPKAGKKKREEISIARDFPKHDMNMLIRKFFYRGNVRYFPASLLVTGATGGVGASKVAEQLAQYLVRLFSLRALLVRADCSRNREDASVNASPHFMNWLSGDVRVAPPDGPGVVQVAAGPPDPKASALALALTQEKLASLAQGFDIVIIDAAPVGSDSVAFHLASLAEGVIVVVQAEQTRKKVLKDLCDNLLLSGARIVGAVCNRRRFYIPNWLYTRLS